MLAALILTDTLAALCRLQSVLLLHALRSCRTLASLSLEGNGYVKRKTRSSLQRFHDGASSAPPGPPSSLEVAAANALALLLGGKSSTGDQTQQLAKHPSLSDVRSSFSKPVALKELCLKSESAMIFGAHVVAAAVDALGLNQRLQVLDVSGNECGDVLASRLGSMLRTNRSLQVLFWDDNFTTVDGFFQFYDGLLANPTLVMVQMPIKDTRRVRSRPGERVGGTERRLNNGCMCSDGRSSRSRRIRPARSSSASWPRSSRSPSATRPPPVTPRCAAKRSSMRVSSSLRAQSRAEHQQLRTTRTISNSSCWLKRKRRVGRRTPATRPKTTRWRPETPTARTRSMKSTRAARCLLPRQLQQHQQHQKRRRRRRTAPNTGAELSRDPRTRGTRRR